MEGGESREVKGEVKRCSRERTGVNDVEFERLKVDKGAEEMVTEVCR
jgi:hypothetical protein